MEFFVKATRWIAERGGDSVALVTVVDTSGSVPRHVGARMLIAGDGSMSATIGGGRVEAELTALATEVARGNQPAQVVTHHLVRDLAMCCGGSMTFLVQPVVERDVFASIASLLERRQAVSFRCGESEMSVEETDERTAPSWDESRFVQILWPRERALVFGAGHLARALVPLLRSTDFEIVVCDDNELGALERIEDSVDTAIASFELFDIERGVGPIGAGDFALVLTRDHAIDQRLVEQLLAIEALTYVGLIGSLGKVGRFHKRLLARGSITESQWQRLHAPVGVDIDAETPAEIAVSICAQLVERRAALRSGKR